MRTSLQPRWHYRATVAEPRVATLFSSEDEQSEWLYVRSATPLGGFRSIYPRRTACRCRDYRDPRLTLAASPRAGQGQSTAHLLPFQSAADRSQLLNVPPGK